ncbi:alpha-L-rhamnosidase C-terminal domain-containing protein [Streptomyces pseudogriseolus]|uniref:glycoside hydrolase family 78 protein n=1 Tax=Streptomyces pseudogriseolus TaxID=36817 RepID=UPI003FA25568
MPVSPTTTRAGGRAAPVEITSSTVEYARQPLGLDEPRPRFSWPMASDEPGLRQSAYQLRVATSASALARPDVWDSGRAASEESVLVPYEGPELRLRTRYFWTVRVWDGQGRGSRWSEPDWWETGLMGAGQWAARWISAPAELTDAPSFEGGHWICFPEGDPASSAPAATRWFRRTADLPPAVVSATMVITADNAYSVSVNGYAHIAGIAPGRPGYREVVVRPRPGGGIDEARATLSSVRGPVSTRWRRRGGHFELTCSVPVNTTAQVWIPASATDRVEHTGAALLRHEEGCQVFRAGSGTHRFAV